MGYLKKLSVLALQHNNLSEVIPSSFGNLRLLRKLDLSFNALSGTIPERIAKIPQLEVLDIRNNSLSGVVPPGKPIFFRYFLQKHNILLISLLFQVLYGCIFNH